jgi:hypothetical protein
LFSYSIYLPILVEETLDVGRIINLETLTGSAFHADDVDNNGNVNISDAIDV